MVLTSTIDYAMNPQEALDAPRIQWIGGKKLQIEREAGEAIAEQLRAMGHEVEIVDDRTAMGRGEIIWKCENGVYAAGTEPRCGRELVTKQKKRLPDGKPPFLHIFQN